ncbi:MAG: type I restriction enzyme HsdR N-terminal domain-containing protein [Bacteroidales bacterium]|nr:type I restriction enzyme HsdR N-terminal domain-containing protein [Candidatus Cryptobacteroides caccocaballi]
MGTKQTIWDPLRRKEVALTPEERVRQWFISVLLNDMKVPAHMMMSEVGMKLGDKQWRADILVYDRRQKPLAVVECKRPDVSLDNKVLDQTVRYNMVLDVSYVIITNGKSTYMMRLSEGGVQMLDKVPQYEEMLAL